MSYNTKEVWIPVDSFAELLTGTETSDAGPLQAGGGAITRGYLHGVRVRASNADAQNTAIPVKIYLGAPGTGHLIYSATFSNIAVNNGSVVDHVDLLDVPMAFFVQPQVQVGPQQGSVDATTYTVTMFVRGIA